MKMSSRHYYQCLLDRGRGETLEIPLPLNLFPFQKKVPLFMPPFQFSLLN